MKKLKIFLIGAVVIVLGAGGYLLYTFKFKEYEMADDEVKEIVAEPYKVELPDGSTIIIDENGLLTEENGTTETNEQLTVSGSTSSSSNTEKLARKTAGVTPPTTNNSSNTSNDSTNTSSDGKEISMEKPTVAQIKDKYKPAMEGLESQANSKINALIGRAMNEYESKKKAGEKIDFGYFYNKYMAAASELEANTDTIFQAVVHAVENDLESNGYDKSYAQSFKDEYEASKKARRDGILSKALGK